MIVRLKSASDDAVPSANAIQLSNLIALAALTGDASFDARARNLMAAFSGAVASSPVGHCGLLAAALDLDALTQVKIPRGPVLQCSDPDHVAVLHGLSLPGAIEFTAYANGVQFCTPAENAGSTGGTLVCVGTGLRRAGG